MGILKHFGRGLFVIVMLWQGVSGKVIYVDQGAPAGGDGHSWGTAYRFLQDGLGAAKNGDKIWVTAGIYKPDQREADPNGTGLRTELFQLVNGVRLYGGFSGKEDPQTFHLENRHVLDYETILSGDLRDNDNGAVTGKALLNDPCRDDNSYHIFKGVAITDATRIDGFTITGAHANGASGDSSLGGGLLNSNNSNPQLWNCRFIRNVAGRGGAIYNYRSSNRTVNTEFIENASVITGGAILNGTSLVAMKMSGCTFRDCFSEGWGGAVYNNNGGLMHFEQCLFVNNKVWKYGNTQGGAICNLNSEVTAESCTFAGNISDNEGGGLRNENGTVGLVHCILWENEDKSGTTESAQVHNLGGTVEVAYNCVMGWSGTGGEDGNFEADPLFADQSGGDVHLRSEAGRWEAVSQSWVRDGATSPCIDAGDPQAYWADEPLSSGGRLNLGGYGGTRQASKSAVCTGGVDGNGRLIGDVNRDCVVNLKDLAWMAGDWLQTTVE